VSAPTMDAGTKLLELSLYGGPTFIVSTAIATRDYIRTCTTFATTRRRKGARRRACAGHGRHRRTDIGPHPGLSLFRKFTYTEVQN
jgi:hypothetical protein